MAISMNIRDSEMNKVCSTRHAPIEINTRGEDPCLGQALWVLSVSSPGILPAAAFAPLTGVNQARRAT